MKIFFTLLVLAVAAMGNPIMGGAEAGHQPSERDGKFFGLGLYGGWGYGYGYPYYGYGMQCHILTVLNFHNISKDLR